VAQKEPILFSEVQALRQWHVRVVLAFPPAAVLFITCRQIIWHKPWGSPPPSNGGLIFLSVLLVAVYFRLITVKLVTELRRGEIAVGLRGLWKRQHIPLDQVQSAGAVTYDPVAEFGGYGIRSSQRGKAYIARGTGAVELLLRSGNKILIGSQVPEELARKIRAQKQVTV
jgi:hypothetical protein